MPRIEKRLIVLVVALTVVLATLGALMRRSPDLRSISGNRVTAAAVGSKEFRLRYGYWPTNLEQMVRSGTIKVTATNDAWGYPLIYVPYDPVLMRGTVTSYGADGQAGGAGEAADIRAAFR